MIADSPGPWIRRRHIYTMAIGAVVAATIAVTAWGYPDGARAQTAPTLGAAESFAVLAFTTVTNTGDTVVTGDLGLYEGTSVTGFPPGDVQGGDIYTNDGTNTNAQEAQDAVTVAFTVLDQTCPEENDLTGIDLGNQTLTSGVYCFDTSAQLTGTLTLDGEGDPDAVFIFKTGSTLTTASAAVVSFINDAQACNVFWRVGSSATLGTTTSFAGDILAQASITLDNGANTQGRLLARTGAVTMDTNEVTATQCQVVEPTATSTSTSTATATSTTAVATATATAPTDTPPAPFATATAPPATPTTEPSPTATLPPAAPPPAAPTSTVTVPPLTPTPTPPGSLPLVPEPTPAPPATGNAGPAGTSGAMLPATWLLGTVTLLSGLAMVLAWRTRAIGERRQ